MTGVRRARGESGASTVEFALVLVPFLTLVFAMIQLSIFFWAGQSGATAAREAARRSAVGDLTCAQLTSAATDQSRMVSGSVSVSRTYHASTYTTITSSTPSKTAAQVTVGDNVRVVVRFQTHDMHFPFVPVPAAEGVRARIAESAVARVESVTASTAPC